MPNYRSLIAGGFFSADPYNKVVPTSIRCNNPGAINGATWETLLPGFVATVETTPGNKTTIFESPEQGVAAWFELLRRYHAVGADTVEAIIRRYGGGQDYSAYADFVADFMARRTGFPLNKAIDLDDDQTLLTFGKAMFRYEAGRDTPLSDAQILYGIHLGRGTAVAPVAKPTPEKPGLFSAIVNAILSLFRPHADTKTATGAPSWYVAGAKDIGFHEIGVNQGIDKFIASAKCGALGDPWCAIWVNAKLEDAGIRGTRSAAARSFETNTGFVRLSGPALGCIVTMWRGSIASGTGHVFLYDGENASGVRGIGANEDDGIRRSFHQPARIVGYWWPKSVPLPVIAKIIVTSTGTTATTET